MSQVIHNLHEMTDSRELMESKPHPFITIFISLLVILLLFALVWSYFGEIDVVVKANGVVRPNKKVSRVVNKVSGRVINVYYKSGQKVRSGDVLFNLDYENLQSDKQLLESNLVTERNDLNDLVSLKSELMINKNIGHESMLKKSDQYLLNKDTLKAKLQLDFFKITNELNETKEKLSNLQILESSIKANQNLFDSSNDYYYKYNDFSIKCQQLEFQKVQSSTQFINVVRNSGDELIAKQQVEDSQLKLDSYINEFNQDLRTHISENQKKLKTLEIERASLFVTLNDTIRSKEEKIKSIENQLQALNINMNDRVIKATSNGIVNVVTEINKGDYIQSGIHILSIIPENNSEYTLQLAVLNRDVANIKKGDIVKYNFQALPSKEYGNIEGRVSMISADTTNDPSTGVSYYIVEASVLNRPLYNKKGEEAKIRVGMSAEGSIVTRSEKILYWVLEKIDLKE